MPPPLALAACGALLLLATLLGVLLKQRAARVHPVAPGAAEPLTPQQFGVTTFGAAGTIVQFSTAYCARCPGVRRTVGELLANQPELQFVHLDLTHNLPLAQQFQVRQTPTLLLLDGHGVTHARLSGPVTRTTLTAAIRELTGGTP